MLSLSKQRLFTWISALLIAGVLAGCGASQAPAPAQKPAEPAAPATAPAAAAPTVDKAAVIKAAGIRFFNAVPPTLYVMDAPPLKQKIDSKEDMFILDIRGSEDFAKGHIPNAVNIPFATVGKNLDKLPADKQIIVICYSGQTAGQIVGLLRTLGYNAVLVKGGFPAWTKENYPVATEPAAPAARSTSAMAFTSDQEIIKEAVIAYLDKLPPNSNMMDNKDLKAKLDAKDMSIFTVDIRPADVYSQGHIEGVPNIVMATLGQNLDKLPTDKQIVVNCNGGFTSGQTVAVLKMMGYNAISLKGGYQGWLKAELPIVK